MSNLPILPYSEIRERMRAHPLRQVEIPVEHAVSLAMPTRRFGAPGYAYFASPTTRRVGEPVRQSPPDRWWVLSAQTGRLLIYSLVEVQPFAEPEWAACQLPPVLLSVAELRQALENIEQLLDQVVPGFFAGRAGDRATLRALSDLLAVHLPVPMLPQYKALAADFFAWLDFGEGVPR